MLTQKTSYLYYWLEFVLAMTQKEVKARYKHAILGFLWLIINPLLQMLVMGFVFQFFIPVKIDNYFLFLFAGLLPWNFFSQSVLKSTPSIVYERNLIQKAKFPRESIVISIILSNFFHLSISLGLLIIVLLVDKIFLDHYTFAQLLSYLGRMLWIFPAALWLLTLTVGLGLLFAAWNVRYRDVSFIVSAIIPLWFYATPVIYTLNLLPEYLHFLAHLNPMTTITQLFHFALLNQSFPDLYLTLVSFLVTFSMVSCGVITFYQRAPFFDDWV